MHRRRHHTVYPVLAAATLSVVGCHATGPLQRSVQVSNRPTDDLAEVDAPPQRLATSQPRGVDPAALPERSGDSATRATDDRIAASLATLEVPPSRRGGPQPDVSPQEQDVSTKRDVSAAASRPELTSAMLPAVEQKELIDAFSSSPPEVQELALRQLIAMASRTAERTSQPGNIEDSLARAVGGGGVDPPPESSDVARAVGSHDTGNGPEAVAVTPVSAAHDLSDADTRVVAAGGGSSSDERSGAANPKSVVKETGKVGSLHDFRSGEAAVAERKTSRDASLEDVRDEDDSDDGKTASAEPKTLSDRELFEMLTSRLLQPGEEAGKAERSRREIMARHLMVLAGKPDAAVSEIDGLSEEEQEYVRHQLLALWTIVDPGGHPVTGRRFSTALPQLREATKYLAASTDTLEVRSLAFCTEIEAYGQIKEFPRSRFKPGQQVILYCEIENFTSQRSGDGFETHLEGSYSVYNEDDQKVFSQVLPADKQVSRNYLRDYFIAYQMYLPKQLTDGRYRLELTMEDVEGKKYGQASLPFEIREP